MILVYLSIFLFFRTVDLVPMGMKNPEENPNLFEGDIEGIVSTNK